MTKCKGVISSGDQLTSEAGAEILKAGGNAFDAAISATFMSFAASSSITSAGGGGFLMAHPSAGANILYDFFVQTPLVKRKRSEIDFHAVDVDFGDKTQEFHVGAGSIATPGNIAGLFEVHANLGSMPMTELMAPVLERIKKGIKIHKQTKYQIDILAPILAQTAHGKSIYFSEEKTHSIDDTYFLPQMADTFDYLSRYGPREFYEGEIAHKIHEMAWNKGGHLTMDDFKNYKVEKRKPLSIGYRDCAILTNPPPNSGGALISFLLQLIESVKFKKDDYGKIRHLQALTDAMRFTDLARTDRFEKYINSSKPLEQLFDAGFIKSIQQTLVSGIQKSGNTTHVSVVDNKGNVASCTTSVGEGCGHYITGTDIMLNNMLGEEDLNKQGFHNWQPDQRMSSMMSPTIVLKRDGSMMGLGSGGSNRIRSAIVQAILNYTDFHLPADEISNNSRIHFENEHLDIEPGFQHDELDKIKLPSGAEKFFWSEQNMYFGGVHAVFMDSKYNLSGAGDRRRAGHVINVY